MLMNRKGFLEGMGLALAVALLGTTAATPQLYAAESAAVTMTVTAVGKKDAAPPPVAKSDVELYKGKERLQVADWRKGETLLLAIVIDDSLGVDIASQWNDLKAFIMEQPPTTNVGVFYGRNGTVLVAQDFTADHALAAKALRLPIGGQGAFSSPYLELQDMIKRWPDNNERKSIVLISSGIDYFRGYFGPTSPDLDPTIERAQKSNVNIWTIYAPDSGHVGRGYLRVFNAQSNLSQLSDETGAESYYLGFGQPVTLKSYFDEISTHLNNQYLLTFATSDGGKRGRFERVRVATEIPKVEFLTPSEVFVPKSE
jgi:VWFA-related protein